MHWHLCTGVRPPEPASVRPTGAGGCAATTNRVCGRRALRDCRVRRRRGAWSLLASPAPSPSATTPPGVAPAHPSRKPASGGTRKQVSPSSKHEKTHAASSTDEVEW